MKVLLTGHKGFIGSNLLDFLKDHEVTTFQWGDKLPDFNGLDWVVHVGANSSTVERDVDKIMTQNFDFSVWLLNECVKHKVNFQYSSSASIYGLGEKFTEDAPVDPRTPYAWSKYLFERYAKTINADGFVIQGFRYFNVYGKGEENKGDQASPFYKFKKQYETTGKIKVFENSDTHFRDFVSVEQVCKTHIDFFDVKESGVWNVGTGKPKSFLEVALSIAPLEAIEHIPIPEVIRQGYQKYTCADMTKTLNSLTKKEIKNEPNYN